ncbi:transient receptor potential cation channel subfamily V member 2 [Petaurus breviceps papuanus]|uniref:transient receptor potential cation channel subfamily V member 2 n=1 Tax=Petaurus breviceps papuanus TaxID=3040969 RepID=UPI0036DE72B5
MPEPARGPAFRLETTEGDQEGGSSAAAATGERGSRDQLPPMESAFQKESKDFSPQIKVNLNYRKGAGPSPSDPNRFDRDRLFNAVVGGNPDNLKGLQEYLMLTSKYLTDSEFTDASTGKTCLMKAVLNLRDGMNECILKLLQIDRDTRNPQPLVKAVCTGEYYKGHSALHIAIEKRSLQCVKVLVENGADLHARASGRFFGKQRQGICFYFGELPLSLAACTRQWDIVSYLLENPDPDRRACLEAVDTWGNTVLHALVMIADDSVENSAQVNSMYDYILQVGARLCPSVKLENIANLQGLTPLKLAAKEGKIEVFKHILQREISGEYRHLSRKFTEWTYGPVQVSLYDLSSVDSCEDNSVLEIIAFGCKAPNRHKMVTLEPLNKLLQEKWESLVPRFRFNLISYFLYMLIFTAVTYHQPILGKNFNPLKATVGNSMLLMGHIFILFGGIYLFFGQLQYFWRRRLFIWTSFVDSYFEILILSQALTSVVAQVLCFLELSLYLPILVFSLVLGWINLLYYARGFQQTGIYSVMIQKVILRDLLRFLLVYFVFLFGFAIALVSLSREVPLPTFSNQSQAEEDKAPYGGFVEASLELFKFTIGMGELEFHKELQFQGFIMFLLLAYVLLTYILLLNMLIALMSETVNSVATDSWSIWKLQRAISVLEMERGYWWCKKKKDRSGILLTVGTTPDQKPDERWCFRVEEINWATWEKELQTLKEEPEGTLQPGQTLPGIAWRRLLSSRARDEPTSEDQVPLRTFSA